jgi:hypothetical protein
LTHFIIYFFLLSFSGLATLFYFLKKNGNPNNPTQNLLLLTCWALLPREPLSISNDNLQLLEMIVSLPEVNFRHRVSKNISGVSSLAQFLVKPSVLDLVTLNKLRNDLLGKDAVIRETVFTICQKNDPKFPSYTLRVHYRPYTNAELDTLTAELGGWKPVVPSQPILREDIRTITFNVSSGVDKDQLIQNLQALVNCSYLLCDPKSPNIAHTQSYMKNVIWTWLEAFGANEARVKGWLGNQEDLLKKIKPGQLNTEGQTYYPFQSYIDVKLNVASQYVFFGETYEDYQFTLRLLGPLDFENLLPTLDFEECLQPIFSQSGVYKATKKYSSLPMILAEAAGARVVPLLKVSRERSKPVGNGIGFKHQADNQAKHKAYTLSEVLEVCTPLANILLLLNRYIQTKQQVTENEALITGMIKGFLSGVVKVMSPTEKDRPYLSGILHRSLSLSLGISSAINSGYLHEKVIECFADRDMELCRLTLLELKWACQEGFIQITSFLLQTRDDQDVIPKIYVSLEESPSLGKLDLPKMSSPRTYTSPVIATAQSQDQGPLAPSEHEAIASIVVNPFIAAQTAGFTEEKAISSEFTDAYDSGSGLGDSLARGIPSQRAYASLSHDLTNIFAVEATDLLVVEQAEGFARVHVRLGDDITLVSLTSSILPKFKLFKFYPRGKDIPSSANVEVTFSNFEQAWDYIAELGDLVVILDGLIMRHFKQQWLYYFPENWSETRLPPLWSILDHIQVFGYDKLLDAHTLRVLRLVVKEIHEQFLRPRAPDSSPSSQIYSEVDDILRWFRGQVALSPEERELGC